MCGRYASSRGSVDLATLFEVEDDTDGALRPDYNIAPTDPAAIVRWAPHGAGVLSMARWGLLGAARMINARAETIATRPELARRRCLVPADGWYEWRAGRPYFMTRTNGQPFAFGGVWTVRGDSFTFSIITLPAVGELAWVHDRMPLLIEPAQWRAWLTTDQAAQMLEPPTIDYRAGIELRPVGDAVGDVRNDGASLTARVSSVEPTLF